MTFVEIWNELYKDRESFQISDNKVNIESTEAATDQKE